MNPHLLFFRRNLRYRRISGGLKTSLQAWVQIKRTSESWWNRSKIQVSWPSSWGGAVRGQHPVLGVGPGEVGSLWQTSLPLSSEQDVHSIPPFAPSTPRREKDGAFASSPACAFTLDLWEQATPAAQPSNQPCADPSGGSTLPPAANLRAVPTSPTPAEEGDVPASVTNQDQAHSGEYWGPGAEHLPLWQVRVPPCPQLHCSWERSF